MKKWIALILMLVLVLSCAGCSTVNETEVSVLWSGRNSEAVVPNSLINAVDRAMYIENMKYTHYAANKNDILQMQQVRTALDAGCVALLVELVNRDHAQTIVDLAKAKNVPVVFFNCDVAPEVIASYDKCALVVTDETTMNTAYGKMIGEYVAENFKKLDRNGDGRISCCMVSEVAELAAEVNKVLTAKGQPALVPVEGATMDSVLATNNDQNQNMIELVLTGNDKDALKVLGVLQSIGYNSNKLKTHCIPLFTVGAAADASAFTDTSAMSDEELAQLIYNAMNLVDAGQMAGTAMEDYDAIAEAAAARLSGLLKGTTGAESIIKIPYTIYTND